MACCFRLAGTAVLADGWLGRSNPQLHSGIQYQLGTVGRVGSLPKFLQQPSSSKPNLGVMLEQLKGMNMVLWYYLYSLRLLTFEYYHLRSHYQVQCVELIESLQAPGRRRNEQVIFLISVSLLPKSLLNCLFVVDPRPCNVGDTERATINNSINYLMSVLLEKGEESFINWADELFKKVSFEVILHSPHSCCA